MGNRSEVLGSWIGRKVSLCKGIRKTSGILTFYHGLWSIGLYYFTGNEVSSYGYDEENQPYIVVVEEK